MYQIISYSDGKLNNPETIFDPRINRNVAAGSLKLKQDGIDELDLTVNPDNPLYANINPFQTHFEVFTDNELLFRGRLLKPTTSMSDSGQFQKQLVIESVLAYLHDSVQRWQRIDDISVAEFFKLLINNHNLQVEDYKRFKVGRVDVVNSTDNVYRYLDDSSTYDVIQNKLINSLGGHLQLRMEQDGNYLDYLAEVGKQHETDTPIRLGLNLKSASVVRDPTAVITRLVPLGATEETTSSGSENTTGEVSTPRVNIKSVNNGRDYLDDDGLQAQFGIIVGTQIWEDVTQPANLLTKAKAWLRSQQSVTESWTVTALELSTQDSSIEDFKVKDRYLFDSIQVAGNQYISVIEKDIDFLNWYACSLQIGEKKKSLSSYQKELKQLNLDAISYRQQIASQAKKLIETSKVSNDALATATEVASSQVIQGTQITGQSKQISELNNLVKELQDQINADGYYAGSIIDVSEFQGTINWPNVVKSGLALATIRVQSGSSHIDETYASNIPNAISAGANYAVYAYFSATSTADAEAEAVDLYNRTQTAVGTKKQPRFYMIDVEVNSVTVGTLKEAVTTYMNKLNSLGVADSKLVIYVSNDLYPAIDTSRTQIWIPSYGADDGTIENSIKPLYSYDLWQYTSKGSIAGITGDVDMSTEPSARFKENFLKKQGGTN